MKPGQYEAYIQWRASMVDFAEDLDDDEAAHNIIWGANDPDAREDFNLLLAFKSLDQVSFNEMKLMEIQYDSEFI
ncbi:Hypothetical protein Tpal_149 [Trichococcus palustris]|jgi:hypothetical protein|uniref:Uncharacterized protein n=1 Tax=Trichococcus palustris TaxID=140314 RepID=A0A143Y6D0_9LACT|nr:hypothetical protein [Trichococcus palustris]CZQ81036.1 Hypothetical protein Tpal_149 [Trichococcus palustris]SFK63402.1 hypothetical protein SAMN04488076_102142 [Trichococcus palustris]